MVKRRNIAHVVVFIKEKYKRAETVACQLIENLLKFGINITTVQPFRYKSIRSVISIREVMDKDIDLLATVGGDGTILRALRMIDKEVPVLGVNVGSRGVLSEILPKEVTAAIDKLIEGKYVLDRRLRIKSSTDVKTFPPVLNEIFFNRVSHVSLPTVTVRKSQEVFLEQKMDGLIVATPTGTTAHSFSGGGPVIYEEARSILLMPVFPLLRLPSIILPSETIEISFSDDFYMIVDGQEAYTINARQWIEIAEHERDAVFVRFNKKKILRQLNNLGF
ncbi:MAG: NAD(+)/NADH kinase [Candidatus Methylarchaceae archaeon HK02M2]|nr:NAD(+)/NADH kinase [Candidatus Methylarchaceae archaeon HK02M2]